jgi:hypothetical protein
MQYSTDIRDAQGDVMETVIGQSPLLRVFNGPTPANAAAPLVSGNKLLAQATLPADYLTPSSNGVKSKQGTWTLVGQPEAGSGTPGTFFRIYDASGSICKVQGTFGVGQEMVPDNNSIANGQVSTISVFSISRANG